MKIIKEMSLILGIYFMGEVIKVLTGLPIPGNIIGFVLLLALLLMKLLKVSQVESVTTFLLENLTFFFIPSGVGLLSSFGLLQGSVLKLILVLTVTTFLTMAVAGITTQAVLRAGARRKK
ncbi:CidA/LrgA family protein [Youngiibacter fragilis]|uniref:Murein hydrolase transporter LrgA n=1 Tax=Youngiibacter fragilis 232.1 TaxID=994573 RepID=V7I3K4_9CLOT|nr:CidA/LrgA family protein [Youngiibacter fragilis]ETA79572.1 murein hydrolase transporter LrgA [Youngiibacter fragilis 232.1]